MLAHPPCKKSLYVSTVTLILQNYEKKSTKNYLGFLNKHHSQKHSKQEVSSDIG